jgi:hypothetical protein
VLKQRQNRVLVALRAPSSRPVILRGRAGWKPAPTAATDLRAAIHQSAPLKKAITDAPQSAKPVDVFHLVQLANLMVTRGQKKHKLPKLKATVFDH